MVMCQNIAARVQTAAEAGMVLITSEVQRLVSGLFVVNDRGLQCLKGMREPISLFQVVRASGTRKRRATAHLALVGGEEELRQLEKRWQRARAGEGQLIWLVGEAGIGKSRLAAELEVGSADEPPLQEQGDEDIRSLSRDGFPPLRGVPRAPGRQPNFTGPPSRLPLRLVAGNRI